MNPGDKPVASGPTESPSGPKACTRCGGRFEAIAAFCPRDGSPLVVSDEEPDPYLGRILFDQFRIEEKIGAGGMGTVYRARQTTIDRDVAIKILHRELTQNADAVRRFHREAKVSSTLDHPNIARTFLFGQLPDGNLYIVMEHLRGRSLLDVLRTDGALSPARALKIATQICDGVGEAHALGIVHRDVKPENLLLVPRGKDPEFVKVLDFGIARFLWGETTIVTQSGLIFGTARYISPEGAQGENTDARSDVYSIAVLVYQLLTGETPFDSPSPVALLMKHIHEPAPDIRSRSRGAAIPSAVANVVMRALAKNPDARPGDAQELGIALRAAATASGIELAPARIAGSPSLTPPEPARPSVSTPKLTWHTSGRADDGAPAAVAAVVPVAHVAASPRSPGPAALASATPVMPAARDVGAWTSETLANAPSPYGADGEDANESLRIPGVPGARRPPMSSAVLTMVVAFVLGAGAVGGGAWIASRILRATESTSVDDLAVLDASARSALDRGALDSPPGDNVAELTTRMLRIEPGHQGALALRRAAAVRLREVGDTAAAQGYTDEARSAYQRALALVPGDAEISAHLAALDRPAVAPGTPAERSIRTEPQVPLAGQPAMLVAALAAGTTLTAAPHFHLTREGRAVGVIPATRSADGRYVATFTFPRDGEYAVRFLGRAEQARTVDLQGLVTVAGVGAPRVAEAPATTQRIAAPGPGSRPRGPAGGPPPSPGERIDWTIPPMFGPVVTPNPGTTIPDPLPPPQTDNTPPPPPPVDNTPPPPPPNDDPPPPPAPWSGTAI